MDKEMQFAYNVAERIEYAKDLTEIKREYCVGMVQIESCQNAQLLRIADALERIACVLEDATEEND